MTPLVSSDRNINSNWFEHKRNLTAGLRGVWGRVDQRHRNLVFPPLLLLLPCELAQFWFKLVPCGGKMAAGSAKLTCFHPMHSRERGHLAPICSSGPPRVHADGLYALIPERFSGSERCSPLTDQTSITCPSLALVLPSSPPCCLSPAHTPFPSQTSKLCFVSCRELFLFPLKFISQQLEDFQGLNFGPKRILIMFSNKDNFHVLEKF